MHSTVLALESKQSLAQGYFEKGRQDAAAGAKTNNPPLTRMDVIYLLAQSNRIPLTISWQHTGISTTPLYLPNKNEQFPWGKSHFSLCSLQLIV